MTTNLRSGPTGTFRECSCWDCRKACLMAPGLLEPDDVPRIAAFLLTDSVTLLSTQLVEDGAAVAPRRQANGACVFYDGPTGRCMVHPVKPLECRLAMHDNTREQAVALHARVRATWNMDEDTNPVAG